MSACDFEVACGRPLHHQGHHGGWRTRVSAVAPNPIPREINDTRHVLGRELTARELAILAEVSQHGRYKEVAACLGASEQTVKNHAAAVLLKTGASTLFHAALLLGWVSLPAGVGHEVAA